MSKIFSCIKNWLYHIKSWNSLHYFMDSPISSKNKKVVFNKTPNAFFIWKFIKKGILYYKLFI